METGTENRRVLFEVEVLSRSHERTLLRVRLPGLAHAHGPSHRGGDYGRYAASPMCPR